METARQTTILPTNKLLVMSIMVVISYHLGGMALPPEIVEAYGVIISTIIGVGTAWFVPDAPNVPTSKGDFDAEEG